uniref:Platelet-derived growth factor (PDGF) family profile domain-containing protein n=1 Tax=Mola mola TaxID=94237 RepID=A0A3Q4ANQ9_MOLML
GTMHASQLLLALLLRLVPAQVIMALYEVWAKSMCQPMEQLVDVEREYPGEVESIYVPACVPLKRCSGCCGDEHLECQPTLEHMICYKFPKGQSSNCTFFMRGNSGIFNQRCSSCHRCIVENISSPVEVTAFSAGPHPSVGSVAALFTAPHPCFCGFRGSFLKVTLV